MKLYIFTFYLAIQLLTINNHVFCQDSLSSKINSFSKWDSIKTNDLRFSIFTQPYNHILMYEEIGTGYGLGFEYFFGKNSAVQIPVIYFSEGGIKGLVSSLGLKLYPYGYKKIFSWSIGSNVKFGRIRVANFHEYNYNKITYKGNVVTNILGFDLQNTLKVRIKRLYLELGNSLGMTHAKENSFFINSNFGIGFNFR